MATVSRLRSMSTPLTGPRTRVTPAAIFSSAMGAPSAAKHTRTATTLLAQPSLIGLKHILPLVHRSPAWRVFLFRIELEHHFDWTLELPRREAGDPLHGARGGSLDLRLRLRVRDAQT